MSVAIYPGSFDPITLGHIDIVSRASRMYDRLIVAIANNTRKSVTFSAEDRVEQTKSALKSLTNVEVIAFNGLTIELARQYDANILIRGLRAASDFEFEFALYQMNKQLNPEIEVMFMMAALEHQFLSSSLVKEIAGMDGDVSQSVPPAVEHALKSYYAAQPVAS